MLKEIQQAAIAVVVYVRKSKDDQSLQAASVVGPESLPRQLPVGHSQLVAENVKIHLLQAVQPYLRRDSRHEDSKGSLELLSLGLAFAL